MYIIPCSDNCLYQKDGYCSLETSSSVNNVLDNHCIYYVKKKSYKNSKLKNEKGQML